MSRRSVVRKPLSVRDEASGRALDQRLALRAPWLSSLGARLMAKLPPTSRVRQAVIWRAARLGAEAFNRRDFEAVLIGRHPAVEYHPPRELVEGGGLEATYRGHRGYVQFVNEWLSAWGEFGGQPRELIDLGDQLVLVGEAVGRGEASGVPVRETYAVVLSLKNGRVIRERYYADAAQALEAAGLPASER
jgi:ketosteroid isomerase-like protein